MQIRRLRELVEQLLDLSRLDAEAVVIRPQRVRVRDRLEEIVHSVSPLESVQIGLEVDPSLEAELDVAALDRIVSNLILNACRYGEPPVLVSAATEHGTLRVTVQDRGPGVPAEFVPLLFDRFARSAGSAASPGTRPRPRDRPLVRAGAQRGGQLPPGCSPRRRVRARLARVRGGVARRNGTV